MTDTICAYLATRVAALPFVARAYGLARAAEVERPNGADVRLIRYPRPVDPIPAGQLSAPPAASLLPTDDTAGCFWLEEPSPATLSGNADARLYTQPLRLVGWLNETLLSGPLPEALLLQALAEAVTGPVPPTAADGLSAARVKVLQALPSDGAALLSRYTLLPEARVLLQAPYRFVGLTLSLTGYLPEGNCLPLLPWVIAAADCPAPVPTPATGSSFDQSFPASFH